jgi:hypothetical protein
MSLHPSPCTVHKCTDFAQFVRSLSVVLFAPPVVSASSSLLLLSVPSSLSPLLTVKASVLMLLHPAGVKIPLSVRSGRPLLYVVVAYAELLDSSLLRHQYISKADAKAET